MADDATTVEPGGEGSVRKRRRRRSSSRRRREVQTRIVGTDLRLSWRPPAAHKVLTFAVAVLALAVSAWAVLSSGRASEVADQARATFASTSQGMASGSAMADRMEASARMDTEAAARQAEALRAQPTGVAAPMPLAPPLPASPRWQGGEGEAAAPAYAPPPLPAMAPRSLPDRNSSAMGYTLPASSYGSSAGGGTSAGGAYAPSSPAPPQ
jgi:hypothetical protein